MSEKEAAPHQLLISSLSQHRVLIRQDIEDYLRSQYEDIDVDGTTIDHFTRIINSMKTSPKVSICRVNLLLENSIDSVLEEINHYLSQLFREEESQNSCTAESVVEQGTQKGEPKIKQQNGYICNKSHPK